jgi:hypothetical protein
MDHQALVEASHKLNFMLARHRQSKLILLCDKLSAQRSFGTDIGGSRRRL